MSDRQARHRERQEAGRAVFRIELDVIEVEHALQCAGLLSRMVDPSHSDLERGLEEFWRMILGTTRGNPLPD